MYKYQNGKTYGQIITKNEYNIPTGYWKSSGKIINIKDMSDTHLDNTINWIIRNNDNFGDFRRGKMNQKLTELKNENHKRDLIKLQNLKH